MINLFEYQNKEPLSPELDGLEDFLDDIWQSREIEEGYWNTKNGSSPDQRFLRILGRSGEMQSRKYVGVIHYGGTKINLLPKIFYDGASEVAPASVTQINNHLLWWLSYCTKIRFPSYESSLGGTQGDFFEILIYLFAKYTRKLLSSAFFQQYQEIDEELSFVKGRLNTNRYITENVSRGKWHKLNCTYDAFVADNTFNRIVKYVSKMLLQATSSSKSQRLLREILFLMDEVSDERMTADQCRGIVFNPMFGDFEIVRDYCLLFLSNCISFDYKNELRLFAFLIPMEVLFEDFLTGFIRKELPEIKLKPQTGGTSLDQAGKFRLRPDMLLTIGKRRIIADAKYKIIYDARDDKKHGISQGDLYQMVAYAIRFEIDEVLLFYPNTITSTTLQDFEIIISDELAGREITVRTIQLPIISHQMMKQGVKSNVKLRDEFGGVRKELRARVVELVVGGAVKC